MLKVECPNCGKRFKVAEKYAGQEAACTGCSKPIIIPTPDLQGDEGVDLGDLELDLTSPGGAPETEQDEIGTEADMDVDLPPENEALDDSPLPAASAAADPKVRTFVSIPAIVAIGLGGVALIPVDANAFTYLRMPMSALGLIVGLVSLVTSLTDRRVVPVLPLAAVLVAGAAVALAVTGNVKLGLANLPGDEAEVEASPVEPVVAEVPEPEPIEQPPAAPPPPAVVVSIVSARIAAVEYRDELGNMEKTDKAHLAITLRVENNGGSPLNYTTWAGIPGSYSLDIAALEDDEGNAYRRVKMGQAATPVGRVNEATIEPGEAITDLLLFERPLGRVKLMRLELPGANVGRSRPYQIAIAADVVKE